MGAPQRCPECEEGAPVYMLTYGDIMTLLLTFFVFIIATSIKPEQEQQLILAAFQGLGAMEGGNTFSIGQLAELGNSIMSLPSQTRGRSLAEARRRAISEFQPEIQSRMMRVQQDERGLVISLSGDAFFRAGSAEIDIENTRGVLQRISRLLSSDTLAGRTFRIEGHTDNTPTGPGSEFATNWELSTARSLSTLRYLSSFGVSESQFQVAGMAEFRPFMSNDTPEGRAYNRRIDIVILSEGNL